MSKILNRDQSQITDQNLLEGLTAKQSSLSSFTVAGTSIKTTDVIATLQARISAAKTVDTTKAAWTVAVQANRDERAKTQPTISGVRQTLLVMFAGAADTLALFGLKPRKVRQVQSPDEKAAAVLKAKATRKARNTMGSRQKARIKGTVAVAVPAASLTASASGAASPAAAPSVAAPPAASPGVAAPAIVAPAGTSVTTVLTPAPAVASRAS